MVLAPLDEPALPRVVASGIDAGVGPSPALDFDGDRLAVSARPCGRVELLLAPVGDSALRRSPPTRCPMLLAGRPRLGQGTLVASIRCDGYRLRCQAGSLRASTVRGHRVVARDRFDATLDRVELRLTKLGRALARRGRLQRVRISAKLGDYIGVGPRGRLHTTITRVRD